MRDAVERPFLRARMKRAEAVFALKRATQGRDLADDEVDAAEYAAGEASRAVSRIEAEIFNTFTYPEAEAIVHEATGEPVEAP